MFLSGGALFFWPIVALDPIPHRLAHVARLGLVFLVIPFHAFLGIALPSGDLLAVVMFGVVVAQWMAADEREAAREDRRLGATGLPA